VAADPPQGVLYRAVAPFQTEADPMSHIGPSHPQILSSLVFVRTAPELRRGSLISSIALFTVTRIGKSEASFDLIHARFNPIQEREAIIADICRMIPDNAQLLVRQPSWEYLQCTDNPGADFPLLDNGRLARALPGTTLLPLWSSDDQITTSGEALGLDMPGPEATPVKLHRRAPLEAMALWSIYLQHFSKKREVRELTAAFQAWHLLEQVKPLPRV
jgi:hypothetical protein